MNPPKPKSFDPALHRILIVDDEEIVLKALNTMVLTAGYQVSMAYNPIEALQLVRKEQFSVVLSDYNMPSLTGLEFLSQVKLEQPDATRLLITAFPSLKTVTDAINKGEIYRFILKPWIREELLATLSNAVQRFELITRNKLLQATTMSMNDKLTSVNRSLEEQNRKLELANQELARNLDNSVQLCLKAMQTFSPTLGTQARRVFEVCKAMADSIELPDDQRRVLEIGSWLHDVGLVGVPRQLIKRWQHHPEDLSEAETALIKQHPLLGEDLAGFADSLRGVGRLIRSHHERFDGSGYPDGLSGENIPWLGRLLGVAVAYAESNHSARDAAEVIRHQSGTHFDPEAVRIFVRSLPHANVPRKQREVGLEELRPGMVLAKGVLTANGMLLIPDGQVLTDTNVEKIRNHHRVSPLNPSMLIYC